MKRRHYLTGAGVALVSGLAGCGGNGDEQDLPDGADDIENGENTDEPGDSAEGNATSEDDSEDEETDDTENGAEDDGADENGSDEGEDEDDTGNGDENDDESGDQDSDDEGSDDEDEGDGEDDDAAVEYRFSSDTGQVSDEIIITGSIDTISGETQLIGGYEAVITYDSDVLTFVSAASGPFQLTHNDQNGQINTVATTPEGAETPVPTAIEIEFTAEMAGEPSIDFRTNDSSVIDVDGNELEVRYHGGTAAISD